MPELGSYARDVVTGFRGVVTGRVEYLTGCHQILLQPRVKDTGEIVGGQWFDVDRCEPLPEIGVLQLPSRTSNGPDLAAPIR